MADIQWFQKARARLYVLRGQTEATVAMDDILRVGPGEVLAILTQDGTVAGVLGPGKAKVSELPFVEKLGEPAVFGRLPVALCWASTEPVESNGEWPLPPISDPGSGMACPGASARGTFRIAVSDVAKLLTTHHTAARPIAADAGERVVRQLLGTAAVTFWNESREPVATRRGAMEQALPKRTATALEPQGLVVSDLRLDLRLPVGFTSSPGSPLR